MTIVVDSDGLIGLLNKDDIHNLESTRILTKLTQQEATLIYPATVIAESTTLLQTRLKKPMLAAQIIELLVTDRFIIEPVDKDTLKVATSFMKPDGSKHDTLFDAIVAACAKTLSADVIFSFDTWYRKLGLKLVEDVV